MEQTISEMASALGKRGGARRGEQMRANVQDGVNEAARIGGRGGKMLSRWVKMGKMTFRLMQRNDAIGDFLREEWEKELAREG